MIETGLRMCQFTLLPDILIKNTTNLEKMPSYKGKLRQKQWETARDHITGNQISLNHVYRKNVNVMTATQSGVIQFGERAGSDPLDY